MAESAENHGDKLQERQIFPGPLIPMVVVSNSDEQEVFDTALDAMFADSHVTAQNSDVIKVHETLTISSDPSRDSSGSLLSPIRSSLICQDGSSACEKEYVGFFVREPRAAGLICPEIEFVNRHLSARQRSSVSRSVMESQRQEFRATGLMSQPNNCLETEFVKRNLSALMRSCLSRGVMESQRPYQDNQVCFQAAMLSGIDGPFDMRSPAVAARASPFVTGNTQVELELKTSAYPLGASGPYLGSTIGLLAKAGDKDNLVVHDVEFYLKFADDFRDTFKNGIAMYDEEVDMLSSVVEEIYESEVAGKALIPFKTIIFSGLDKFMQSLANNPQGCRDASPGTFLTAVRFAVAIQFKWQKRFGAGLFHADDKRMEYMVTYGLLARVTMQSSPKADGSAEWVAATPRGGAGTALINFPVGQWWLNIACALRDGAVLLTGERADSSHQVATYLPLLRGVEAFDSESGCTIYEIEGRVEDVLTQLHDRVGKKIRLIRGYHLKSVNAPEIGIRYDGCYILRRYSLKGSVADKQKYHLKLHYDPVEGESGIKKVFVKPSLRDDWELYKKIEKAQMKKFCSESGYYSWHVGEARDVKDAQEWHRQQRFREQAQKLKI